MRHPRVGAAAALALAVAVPLAAQEGSKAKSFNPPRTPEGRPDMQGYWRDVLSNGFSVEGIAESDPDTRNAVQAATAGPGIDRQPRPRVS